MWNIPNDMFGSQSVVKVLSFYCISQEKHLIFFLFSPPLSFSMEMNENMNTLIDQQKSQLQYTIQIQKLLPNPIKTNLSTAIAILSSCYIGYTQRTSQRPFHPYMGHPLLICLRMGLRHEHHLELFRKHRQ